MGKLGMVMFLVVAVWGCDASVSEDPGASETPSELVDQLDAASDAQLELDELDVELSDDLAELQDLPQELDSVEPSLSACRVSLLTQGSEVDHCEIDPRSMLGCEALARCLCELADRQGDGILDLEQCVLSAVIPRGNITLADYCALSGAEPVGGSLLELPLRTIDLPFAQHPSYSVELSSECAEIAAFTLWGELPRLFLERLEMTGEPPEPGAPVDALSFLSPRLASLEELQWLDYAAQTIRLEPLAEQRMAELTDELMAHRFVFHDGEQVRAGGRFVSYVMSAVVEGTVLVVDELQTQPAEIELREGYPMLEPYTTEPRPLASLRPAVAAAGKQRDAACLSSCGCMAGTSCQNGVCTLLSDGCRSDQDCCLGTCAEGVCL
ncbi:MAG: hypothetical protein RBU37_00485 [Myxococcota bacterium]|jgi:hypothetical protein|nr:hypothetical protein [Myxococcota bacterium]